MHSLETDAHIAISLFAIADPIGAIPLFLSLTADRTAEKKSHTAEATAATVAVVLMLSAFIGEPLLKFFGIRIASFSVAGGILVLMMAIAMLDLIDEVLARPLVIQISLSILRTRLQNCLAS